MLHVTVNSQNTDGVEIALAGDFTSEYIPCVEEAMHRCQAPEGAGITFNLQNVTLVDRGAMCFLHRARQLRVNLRHCPQYVLRWIDQEFRECS